MSEVHPSGRTDDELRRALDRAMGSFLDAVRNVRPDDWAAPSPCEGWSVADVVDHIVMGDVFAAAVLRGATLDQAVAQLRGLEGRLDTAAELVADVAEAARAGFAAALDQIVEHPIGRIPARRFLGFRVLDQLGHSWDVRRGSGQSEELDAFAVDVAIDIALAEQSRLEVSEHFAMPASPPPVTQRQTATFLALIGRSG